jgi:ribonuclease VapC
MMVDSSALVAIARHEPEAARLTRAIVEAPARFISAISWLESMMVAHGRGGAADQHDLQMTIADFRLQPVPFDSEQMHLALSAFLRFGKGRHPAALNLGDCCAYAAAVSTGEPLLFKGEDFARTDVTAAPW